jgi:hypothetical protein
MTNLRTAHYEEDVAEGDINSTAKGSCARTNGGKVMFSLLPLHLLHGVARVLMFGSKKYAPWNWAKGGAWSTPFDSCMRHLIKFWYMSEDCDEESGLHHLDHAICNLIFLRHYYETYGAGEDRPPPHTDFSCLLSLFSQKLNLED